MESLVKTSHLLAPFPEAMIDSAFFDRFHAYIPGWEIPKMRPEFFTNRYGLITDYLAEFMREMRKRNFSDAIDRYFRLGRDLNQRDTIAVRLERARDKETWREWVITTGGRFLFHDAIERQLATVVGDVFDTADHAYMNETLTKKQITLYVNQLIDQWGTGIVAMLLLQVFENVGMNIGIMPITGIPLPLFSYGGSSVISTLLAVGLLQAIYARGRALQGKTRITSGL